MKTKMKELIIALDAISRKQAIEYVKKLAEFVWGFKVNDLLLQCGVEIIEELTNYTQVFADPKLYDTPNTVYNSVENLSKAGTSIITVHASGGEEMLTAALNASKVYNVEIAAVTTLTSMTDETIRDIYHGFPFKRFSEMFKKVGIKTVVCAGRESEVYKSLGFKTIVPGFRPFGQLNFDDQKRITNVIDADYLVVGRPVLQHANPVEAVKQIKEKFLAF